MTNNERYEKYINEICKNCKNKNKEDCEIRISNKGETILTKCIYYERENKLQ